MPRASRPPLAGASLPAGPERTRGGRRGAIEILRYTTAQLPPDERYPNWLSRTWPRVDAIYRTEPIEPFLTLFETAELGEIVFVYAEITGMRWERRLRDIRASDFDSIIVNMMVEGFAQGNFDGREFREEAGSFHFHDLTKPSIHVSTASRTFSTIIPRPIAAALFGTLDDLHGLVVSGAAADLLLAHAAQVWKALPELDRTAAPALGRSLLALLAAAAAQARLAAPPARTTDVKLRRRAEAEIGRQLNKPLTIAGLCRALNVSRKSLFAAFREDGGVHNYIRAQRLELAKASLADLERGEPIGMIAVRLGFCDASHLTRLFRARYGMAPRDYRRLVETDASSWSDFQSD
jgi:AraC-like DNA-binding protein